jgi:very-short-patch-repair endonuclease
MTQPRELERAVGEAYAQRLVRVADLKVIAASSRRGSAALRAVLVDSPSLTRSEAERRLLALTRRAGLPRPRTNVRVGGHEVDALWPDQWLIVEVDGYAFHSARAAFERDRLRDADLQAAGYRVLRITWRQLDGGSEALAARLGAALHGSHGA